MSREGLRRVGSSTFLKDTAVTRQDIQWWRHENPAAGVWNAFKRIEQADQQRIVDYRVFYRLYTNYDILSLDRSGAQTTFRSFNKASLNMIAAVVDTASSRIIRQNPTSKFATKNGNRSLRRKARTLEKWVDMQKYITRTDQRSVDVFLDCAVFGTGVQYNYRRGEEIKTERVFPGEMFVDPTEGRLGEPQTIYRRQWVSREVLKGLYPDKAEVIENLKDTPMDPVVTAAQFDHDTGTDMVEVVTAHRLAQGTNGPGRFAVVAQSELMTEGPWVRSYFPYSFMRWKRDRRGFWGLGLCHELVGLQVEINRLVSKLDKILRLSAPQVWMDIAARIKTQPMSNEVGGINHFRNKPPIFTPGITPQPELIRQIDKYYSLGFELAGVSRMSAAAQRPPGVESAVAIREVTDIETMRFTLVSREWEWFTMDYTRQWVDLGRDIFKSNPDYRVVAKHDRGTIDEVPWADIDLEDDAYVLQVFPASSLPNTPGGRKSFVSDLYSLGLLNPVKAMQLLDFPDFDEMLSLDRAASDNIDRIIENIIDEGIYEAPEPFQDHQLALKKAQASYNKYVGDEDVDEDRLHMLRNYMTQTNVFMQRATLAAQAPILGGQPGFPPAAGPTGQAPTAVTPQDGSASF